MSSLAQANPVILFVLGGPGVGKGTQCARLVQEFGFVHISVGDLLRKERDTPGSEHGALIAHNMRESILIPPEISVTLLGKEMEESAKKGKTGFLIDGFPRSMAQALAFEKMIPVKTPTIFLDCSEDVMLKRLGARAGTSGRDDDTEYTIKKRLVTFKEETVPVLEHLQKKNEVITIHCEGTVDQIYEELRPEVERVIASLLAT